MSTCWLCCNTGITKAYTNICNLCNGYDRDVVGYQCNTVYNLCDYKCPMLLGMVMPQEATLVTCCHCGRGPVGFCYSCYTVCWPLPLSVERYAANITCLISGGQTATAYAIFPTGYTGTTCGDYNSSLELNNQSVMRTMGTRIGKCSNSTGPVVTAYTPFVKELHRILRPYMCEWMQSHTNAYGGDLKFKFCNSSPANQCEVALTYKVYNPWYQGPYSASRCDLVVLVVPEGIYSTTCHYPMFARTYSYIDTLQCDFDSNEIYGTAAGWYGNEIGRCGSWAAIACEAGINLCNYQWGSYMSGLNTVCYISTNYACSY